MQIPFVGWGYEGGGGGGGGEGGQDTGFIRKVHFLLGVVCVWGGGGGLVSPTNKCPLQF